MLYPCIGGGGGHGDPSMDVKITFFNGHLEEDIYME
jgi:hypothetical protein